LGIEDLFDKYLYYCVTSDEANNLMWSHYANSHRGFCIEWDADKIAASKVEYRQDIADFEIIDFLETRYGLDPENEIGEKIWQSLLVKLEEWDYESEYRFQMSSAMESLVTKREKNYALVKYEPSWIKSITWGYRTLDSAKSYIKDNLPFRPKFRQAYPGRNRIRIRDEG